MYFLDADIKFCATLSYVFFLQPVGLNCAYSGMV